MQVAETVESVRQSVKAARAAGKRVALVPTMGALHKGHRSLIARAARECDFVVVSIFVNPTQFGPAEDFKAYPRPVEDDLRMCEQAGVDVVFNPPPDVMYPGRDLTWVTVDKLTDSLCGASRPDHFRGVTTVCCKLFNIVAPDAAYFGQKDAQQVIVIERMAADLNMPLEIVVCPTIREDDGLAISSRNKYLSPAQRKNAPAVYKALNTCRELIEAGATDIPDIIARMRTIIEKVPDAAIDYISIVDAQTLQPAETLTGTVLVAAAVQLGPARLIDNILVTQ